MLQKNHEWEQNTALLIQSEQQKPNRKTINKKAGAERLCDKQTTSMRINEQHSGKTPFIHKLGKK